MISALISYYYWKKADFDALFAGFKSKPTIFADSGAFSAKTLGATISLADYAAWIKRWAHIFEHYATLDVIGDWKATDENQKRLEGDYGLRPVPAFHWGSPMAELDRLCDRYDYVALGAIARLPKRTSMPWLAECFRIGGKRVGFHGFAATSFDLMRSFPWRSVDSSSWVVPQKFGSLELFDGTKTRRVKFGSNATNADSMFLRAARTQSLLNRNGITSELVLGRAPKNAGEYQGMIAARRIEQWLQSRTGTNTPRLYLAIALTRHVEMLKRYEEECDDTHLHATP